MRELLAEVLLPVVDFFIYALVAVFAQNAVFNRALGVSRLVYLVDEDGVHTGVYCLLLTVAQLIAAPLAFYANQWITPFAYTPYVRPLVFVGCSTIAFIVVLVVSVLLFKNHGAATIVKVLPMACFNCTIIGTLLVSSTQSFLLWQTIAFALGSSVGYLLAAVVVTEAQRKLQNRNVPAALRGLPITLLYIGIISLALYAFTGHAPAV